MTEVTRAFHSFNGSANRNRAPRRAGPLSVAPPKGGCRAAAGAGGPNNPFDSHNFDLVFARIGQSYSVFSFA
jgi:hypothetical protein